MRLLFVSPYVPSPIRVRPYHLIRMLSRRHEVTVLACARPSEEPDAEHIRSLCSAVHTVPLKPGESLRGCLAAAMRGEPLQSGYCWSPAFVRQLSSFAASGGYEVVHIEHLRAGHAGMIIPPSVPTVFDSVDCISLLLERTLMSSHSTIQRLLAALELTRCRRYEARLIRRFKQSAVTSPEDAAALKALEPTADVTVIPNGVDLEYFQPREVRRDPATMVFSGKMSYHANVTAVLHFAQKILPLIRQKRPDVGFVVAGSNPPPAVRALARDPAVKVTGYLPDIREALSRSTVAICPVTVKVGIQNKVLEAMAMGLPVVCSRQGATGLEIEPGRDALVADSANEFADHVCRVLDDGNLQARLGESGRRYVEARHRWESAARSFEDLYAQAASARSLQAA